MICILAKERFSTPSFANEQASIQLVQPEHFLESTKIYPSEAVAFLSVVSTNLGPSPLAIGILARASGAADLERPCFEVSLIFLSPTIWALFFFTMNLLESN
jgi:hypothetical protein